MDCMKVCVVSKSGNGNFALLPENIIDAFWEKDAFADALIVAERHAREAGDNAHVYSVSVTKLGVYRETRSIEYVSTDES